MMIQGVYKVDVVQFESSFPMELHIKQDDKVLFASLKGQNFTRTLYNGRAEHQSFIFYNAQVDDYVKLVPPGGYHIGGVEFGGTVCNDRIIGTIKFKNGLIFSIHGSRIDGEPDVNYEIRKDGIAGRNRDCVCKTRSCTHHGFCDSCHLFDSAHGMVTRCISSQYEELFPGRINELNLLGPEEPEVDE